MPQRPSDTSPATLHGAPRRPARLRIADEMDRPQTLSDGPEAWEQLTHGNGPVVLLGLGPLPASTPATDQPHPVWYMECPAFAQAAGAAWLAAIPATWQQLASLADLPPHAAIFLYRQNLKLFPTFWGPLVAQLRARIIACRTPQCASRTVLLPGTPHSLLLPELEAAFTAEGYTPRRVDPDGLGRDLATILAEERPALTVSVNLAGMDALGERFHLLRACNSPTVIWCVDNPWHVLSALRLPWWRQAHLCVTDASFLPDLAAHGAGSLLHMPLAAWPELFAAASAPSTLPGVPPEATHRAPHNGVSGAGTSLTAGPNVPCPHYPASLTPPVSLPPASLMPPASLPRLDHVVFVGRSAFPDRDRYFAGCRLPDATMHEAQHLLHTPTLPDYHWWTTRLGTTPLWPSAQVRTPGYGAELCSTQRRALCLDAAAPLGLTVFGDAGWQQVLPATATLHPPVDYYTTLPHIYARAHLSLNVTSLLLPAGLTQRHFDVWMAGGFVLTDATPGLGIFPRQLTEQLVFRTPADLPATVRRLDSDPALRVDLQRAWVQCLHEQHTYRHRIRTLLEHVGLTT